MAALQQRATLTPAELAQTRLRLERPEPRVRLGEALRGVAHAALDVSDGLTGDLPHILAASQVGATLDLAAIPHSQALASKLAGAERDLAVACLLAGGDDYELCFTAPETVRARIAGIAAELGLPLSRIGKVVVGKNLVVLDPSGRPLPGLPRAFEHFAT